MNIINGWTVDKYYLDDKKMEYFTEEYTKEQLFELFGGVLIDSKIC